MDNTPRKKYGLFAKFSLAAIGECEVDKNPHIFLIKVDEHGQENNRHFNGTLNIYGPVVFEANQEKLILHI